MKKSQIAAQLYTLREYITNPADIADTLKKVRKIGYEAIQVSGMGPIAEEELLKIAQGEGLTICATHDPAAKIVDETEAVIERLAKLNCKYTAYPHPHLKYTSYTGYVEFAKKLNAAAEKFAAAGQCLCYHNHASEFQKFDGKVMLDIIYDNAPALQAEIDTFWVQCGGANPTEWVKKMSGRSPLLHLKEYAVRGNDRIMEAVGNGNLDWHSIIPAGEAAGVEYFIVEQDDCNHISPFVCLQQSFDYLVENFVK